MNIRQQIRELAIFVLFCSALYALVFGAREARGWYCGARSCDDCPRAGCQQ